MYKKRMGNGKIKKSNTSNKSATWSPEHQQLAAEIVSTLQSVGKDPTEYLGRPIESFTGEELEREIGRVAVCALIRTGLGICNT